MMPYLVFRLCRTIKHYLEVSMHASIEPAATNWKWMANGRWENVWRVHVQFVSARCYRWIEELSMQKKTLKHIYVLVFCFCYLNGQWTYFLTNFFFFMWLYDEARVLSIWFWGASFWIWKSCNMTFNHFGKFLVLGIQVTGFFSSSNLKPVQRTGVFISFICLLQFRFFNIHWITVSHYY